MKKILIHGEKDLLLTQDQLFLTNKEKFQMDIQFISKTWNLIYNLNKMLIGLIKKRMLQMKKLITYGEEKSMYTQK